MEQNNIPIFNKAEISKDFNGECKIKYDDGEYVGPVVKGLAEGKGIYYFKSGAKYDGYWKNGDYEGKGKYIGNNGDRHEGDWKDGKIVKKRKIGKTEQTKSKQTKMFYQINELDSSKTIKQEEYKILQTIDQQNEFIKNKQDIILNEHIKISYDDHGGKDGSLQANINKDLFTNIVNEDTKSFYISSNACCGGFYDENKTTLFDIVKEQIKDKDCIGFVSLVKQEYSNTIKSTINDKGETGAKRIPNNQKGVNVEDVYKNKDEYFEYYCIINEKNKETGLIEQNIYQVPYQLCYWREDLIEQKDETYSNKFIAALTALKEGKPYSFTTDVDENGKQMQKEITISLNKNIEKIKPVEIKEVTKPKIKTDYTQYEIKEIENKNPKKRTKTTTKKQQNNIG